MGRPQRIVLVSLLITFGSTTGASFMPEKYCGRGELPSPRLLFGSALTYAGLSMLADFAPKIATTLAMSVAVTSLTYYGLPIMDAVFTGKECKPVNNGRNSSNATPTTELPPATDATGLATVFPTPVVPRLPQTTNTPNVPGSGNQPARPTF